MEIGIKNIGVIMIVGFILMIGCGEDEMIPDNGSDEEIDLTTIPYNPESYEVTIPPHFPPLEVPADNPMTKAGVDLGRHLFYDPILSIDSTISCASCHMPKASFSDNLAISRGVDNALGERSSMSLLNVALYNRGLFWDGRVQTLEEQALAPVETPHELNNSWEEVEDRLQSHATYQEKFRKAFGIEKNTEITKELTAKAIAQFERIMISKGTAKYDRVELGLDVYTDEELLGRDLYFDENQFVPDAECGHCHSVPLMTANDYFNNGLDEAPTMTEFSDLGRGKVTGILLDNGKFRAPTLRNIIFTAPYMHDGRFQSLEEVIEHYDSGGKNSPNKDPLIRPLNLTNVQKEALVAFIMTMQEPDVMDIPELQNPFK